MKWLWPPRWVRTLLMLAVIAIAAPLACAWHYDIWSWHDYQVYRAMSNECHPVWHDLYWGRIHAGQSIEPVILGTAPPDVRRFDKYVILRYEDRERGSKQGLLFFSGVTVTAKDGKVVKAVAWSCTWTKVFFDALTPEEWNEYGQAYERYMAPQVAQWARERLLWDLRQVNWLTIVPLQF